MIFSSATVQIPMLNSKMFKFLAKDHVLFWTVYLQRMIFFTYLYLKCVKNHLNKTEQPWFVLEGWFYFIFPLKKVSALLVFIGSLVVYGNNFLSAILYLWGSLASCTSSASVLSFSKLAPPSAWQLVQIKKRAHKKSS